MLTWNRKAVALADANRRIGVSQRVVADQKALVERLSAQGQDTTVAEELLKIHQDVLRTMRTNRESIVRAVHG